MPRLTWEWLCGWVHHGDEKVADGDGRWLLEHRFVALHRLVYCFNESVASFLVSSEYITRARIEPTTYPAQFAAGHNCYWRPLRLLHPKLLYCQLEPLTSCKIICFIPLGQNAGLLSLEKSHISISEIRYIKHLSAIHPSISTHFRYTIAKGFLVRQPARSHRRTTHKSRREVYSIHDWLIHVKLHVILQPFVDHKRLRLSHGSGALKSVFPT